MDSGTAIYIVSLIILINTYIYIKNKQNIYNILFNTGICITYIIVSLFLLYFIIGNIAEIYYEYNKILGITAIALIAISSIYFIIHSKDKNIRITILVLILVIIYSFFKR